MASAPFRPTAQPADLLVHRAGQRHRVGQSRENMLGPQLVSGGERVVQGADDGFFDLGPAEFAARFDQSAEFEQFRVASAFAQMNPENFGPLLRVGQVDKKNLVKPPFAQQFGGQLGNVIGGGHDKNRGALFR